ncbi:hypothetical protein AC579_4828 [Pseudocercospora musae]|uniref:Uncharacterized protein n=1 Tax=Pseudocercospora musae TaxID=113226 RepID=A0A139II35_9PEZI|nr:hypothetical protein AC579_4828 [Pseudocercospora musae]
MPMARGDKTPLQQAADKGHQGIIKDLSSAGADPNLLGEKFGGTAVQENDCDERSVASRFETETKIGNIT